MRNFFKILGVLLFLQIYCYGQQEVTIEWKNDTAWFVNYNYDPIYDPEYELDITFPILDGSAYQAYKVDWGDGNIDATFSLLSVERKVRHTYRDAKVYNMKITLYMNADGTGGSVIYNKKVMNRGLTANFSLTPPDSRRCMNWEGDSILLVMNDFENPPGTIYDIKAESAVTSIGGMADSLGYYTWFGKKRDSAWIVATQPTGIYGATVYINMSWKRDGVTLENQTHTRERFSVFDVPDLRKIFNFRDSLQEGEELGHFKLCSSDQQTVLGLQTPVLGVFQYKTGNSMATPYYNSLNDNAYFTMNYFYADTLQKDMQWTDVTGQFNYVDTTSNITFKKAGFYKVRIYAYNRCSYDPKTGDLVQTDSIWTDSLKNNVKDKRYFQVSESSRDNVVCMNDSLCLNLSDEIVFVDRNARKVYDAPPTYEMSISGYNDRPYSFWVDVYKKGKIISGDIATLGCDSTVIRLKLDSVGTYVVWLRRTSSCGSLEVPFDIKIGKTPDVFRDSIYKVLLSEYDFIKEDGNYHKCDSFRYTLQNNLWAINTFEADTNHFYFGKGRNKRDTIINGSASFYDFDSTGNRINYIRVKVHNYCGWSGEEEVDFYTRTLPEAFLLRDSVPHNDSLCLDFDYRYYWGGITPERYKIGARFSRETFVNGTSVNGGVTMAIDDWAVSPPLIKHRNEGETLEHFTIINADMESCRQEYDTAVNIIVAPDKPVYPDSIKYCSSLSQLNTTNLFGTSKVFKKADWLWNKDAVKHELFPVFNFSGLPDNDTLRYKLYNSKGCYIKGQLVAKPKTVPVLALAPEYPYCLPDTIKDFRGAPYVNVIDPKSAGYDFTVYRGSILPSRVQCSNAGCSQLILSGTGNYQLIYEVKNQEVDAEFIKGCYLVDTVVLKLSTPLLNIRKSDTLFYPWVSYDFKELTNFIDTSAIKKESISWQPLNGSNGMTGTGLYNWSYSLLPADQNKDSLLFELSAKTYCDAIVKDTFSLVVSHVKLKGYTDTICGNNDGYPLWDKVTSAFVNPVSVKWELCYPSDPDLQGTLSSLSGTNVVYKPMENLVDVDSVRIYVSGILEGGVDQKGDTIVLRVNPAPVFKLRTDTLMACGRRIELGKIASVYVDSAHCTKLTRGEYVDGENGGWSGLEFVFIEDIRNFSENLWRKVEIKGVGLPGCASVKDTVTFIDPVEAKVTFKRRMEEMCSGDELKLDTIYNMTGRDKFTGYKWALETSTTHGGFDADTSHYIASAPEDHIQKLKVSTFKSYTCYNGLPTRGYVTAQEILPIVVHREPVFNVTHRFDTLCRNINEINIERNWVNVAPSLYPDYRDSLRLNGMAFKTGIKYAMAHEGMHDTLIVTVAQGRCTKWDLASDTIFLYRLPNMVSGTFTVADICEGNAAPIVITPPLANPLAKSQRWTAMGGEIIASVPPVFRPAVDAREGSVTFLAMPPKVGCEEDSLRQDVRISFLPRLARKADTVCRIVGGTVTLPIELTDAPNTSPILYVDWYLKGKPDKLGTTVGMASYNYVLTFADSTLGALEFVAKMFVGAPCNTSAYDTIRVVLQDRPQVIPVTSGDTICQGIITDIGNMVTANHTDMVIWNKKPTTPGTLNGTYYNPVESWGNAGFVVTGKGKHGCPDVVKDVSITVNHAPIPDGKMDSPLQCQQDTIRFSTKTPAGVAAVYTWNFGDSGDEAQGTAVKHIYREPGTYQVRLTGKYGICERQKELSILVNPKPTAMFTPAPQYPIGEMVVFESESEPSGVNCKWYFDNGTGLGTPCSHIFGGVSGNRNVLLEVTTLQGCQDTISHTVTVVEKPKADFSVSVDSCAGVVKIKNLSVRNFSEVSWDFGNSTALSSDWEPQQQYYQRIYDDSTYSITLTLTNAAGSDTKTRLVKMVSKLKAGIEVFPSTDLCSKLDKEVHILTQGKVDTTEVLWGDGQSSKWTREQEIFLLKHRYKNETTSPIYFPVVLVATNVCEKDISAPIAVQVLPVSVKAKILLDSTYKNECYGFEWGFENKSFGFDRSSVHCEWQFGHNGDIITDNSPAIVHLFEKPGAYMVKMRVYDNCNEDVDSVLIHVRGNDSLDFVVEKTPYCSGKDIRMKFVQRGVAPFGDFRWEFQDGRKRTGSETEYSFAQPGSQRITLTAVAEGCKANMIKTIQINKSPNPLVSLVDGQAKGCQPFEVKFAGREVNDEVVTVLWDFKDNAYSDKQDATKVFEKTGIYNVSFRLTTPAGCVDSAVVPIQVLPTPQVKMDVSDQLFCTENGNFTFRCVNISPEAVKSAFEWWKDGEMVSVQSDSVRFICKEQFGDVVIKLKATHQESGCVAEISDTVVSAHSVKATLTLDPSEVCQGAPVKFINSSEFSDFMELSLGDGTIATENNFEHIYSEAGEYPVKLVVSNKAGCEQILEKMVKVNPLPEVLFTWKNDNSINGLPSDLVVPEKENGGIRFENLSQIPSMNGDTLKFRWDFGDNSPVSLKKNPQHLYPNNGSYVVTLHAQSKARCVDSITDVVLISAVKGLYIPTAFAPAVEDEGVNRFQPKGIGLYEYKIRVYDDWGTCVWMSDKLDNGQPAEWWDGMFKGKPLPGGLYKWKVAAIFKDGTVWESGNNMGYVLLMR